MPADQSTMNEISSTAQQYLDIHDITNDLLVLKDGSTALIITVSAMNFGLLAEPEQDAIMYAYAGLLNSLNYPIQILIRSQTKDVTSYLALLEEEQEKATSDIKRDWINRYRSFVADLIKERNVLDKKFYAVIPASSLEMGLLPPNTVVPGVKQPDLSKVERSVILEKAREILEPKRDHLMAQFARIGLNSRQLTTQEIIQLFYLSYNPEAAEGQQITDTSSYTTPLVEASIQGGNMNNATNQPNANPAPAGQAQGTAAPTGAPATPDLSTGATNQGTPQAGGTPGAGVADPSAGNQQPQMGATPNAGNAVTPGQNQAQPNPTPTPPVGGTTPPTPGATPATSPAGGAPSKPMTQPTSGGAPVDGSDDAQNEINSTLKELGASETGAPTPGAGGSPAASTPAASGATAPQSGGGTSIPQNTPTQTGASGAPQGGTEPAASGDDGKGDMKPLPEI